MHTTCMKYNYMGILSNFIQLQSAYLFLGHYNVIFTGIHAILMRMWRDKSGPCMQFLHFAFAFGAFIAPLISKPFISDVSIKETTNHTVSCANMSLIGDTTCSKTDSSNCTLFSFCMGVIANACNLSAAGIIHFQYEPNGTMNCFISSTPQIEDSKFGWAYWIAVFFLIPPLIAFIYFALRHDSCKTKCQGSNCKNGVQDMPQKQQELMVAGSTNMSDLKSNKNCDEKSQNKSPKTYKFPAYIILLLFTLFYVGTEASFGSLVFTYAVKSELAFSKGKAATLAAAFWGPFAFMRLFSVVLVVLKVHSSVMMTMNLAGSLIAVTLFVILPHNNIAIWIVSAGLGASFASIFPTTMTWLSEYLSVSGKATAVVVVGGALGNILIPSLVGTLIGNLGPDSFVYCTFSGVVISAVLIESLFLLTFVYKKIHSKPKSLVNACYKKLDEKYGTNSGPE